MKYVSVTSPKSDMSVPIFNYFDDYLVSLGEPATSRAWKYLQMLSHINNILKEAPSDKNLYIDSGGFQIIVGYVTASRLKEYIDVYHLLLEEYHDRIHRIFSLDVFNMKYDLQKIYDENKYSIQKSIELIKKHPTISDKQLFVLQTSNENSFKTWQKLFLELEVYKYYKLWSVGGLVGLKKTSKAKFSHAVPATLWLLSYQKKFNFTIDQVHWLGQSSRLSFLSMGLFERLYNLNMTSDSSQLVRFAAIEHKLPYICKHEGEFILIETVEEAIDKMLGNHSIKDIKHTKKVGFFEIQELSSNEYYLENNQFHNTDFIEMQAQNIYYEIEFCNLICDLIIEKDINTITEEEIKDLHPIMSRGRVSKELMNNIEFFRKFEDIIKTGDTQAADNIMLDVVRQY
jgi:hypothetical protein